MCVCVCWTYWRTGSLSELWGRKCASSSLVGVYMCVTTYACIKVSTSAERICALRNCQQPWLLSAALFSGYGIVLTETLGVLNGNVQAPACASIYIHAYMLMCILRVSTRKCLQETSICGNKCRSFFHRFPIVIYCCNLQNNWDSSQQVSRVEVVKHFAFKLTSKPERASAFFFKSEKRQWICFLESVTGRWLQKLKKKFKKNHSLARLVLRST